MTERLAFALDTARRAGQLLRDASHQHHQRCHRDPFPPTHDPPLSGLAIPPYAPPGNGYLTLKAYAGRLGHGPANASMSQPDRSTRPL